MNSGEAGASPCELSVDKGDCSLLFALIWIVGSEMPATAPRGDEGALPGSVGDVILLLIGEVFFGMPKEGGLVRVISDGAETGD